MRVNRIDFGAGLIALGALIGGAGFCYFIKYNNEYFDVRKKVPERVYEIRKDLSSDGNWTLDKEELRRQLDHYMEIESVKELEKDMERSSYLTAMGLFGIMSGSFMICVGGLIIDNERLKRKYPSNYEQRN
jgi:hypothetical protein